MPGKANKKRKTGKNQTPTSAKRQKLKVNKNEGNSSRSVRSRSKESGQTDLAHNYSPCSSKQNEVQDNTRARNNVRRILIQKNPVKRNIEDEDAGSIQSSLDDEVILNRTDKFKADGIEISVDGQSDDNSDNEMLDYNDIEQINPQHLELDEQEDVSAKVISKETEVKDMRSRLQEKLNDPEVRQMIDELLDQKIQQITPQQLQQMQKNNNSTTRKEGENFISNKTSRTVRPVREGNLIKSPSDTTLYRPVFGKVVKVPVSQKPNDHDMMIQKISNLVDAVRMEQSQ